MEGMEGMALPAGTASVGVSTHYPIHADLAHLSHDQALMNKIIKKRQDEVARRANLLDPRKRCAGVPHDILASQIAEKKKAAEAEVVEDAYHHAIGVTQSAMMTHLEGMKAQMTRDRHKQTIDWGLQNMTKEQRTEFALSDPSALKKEVLPTNEEIDQMGPSSMLNFKGEHGASKEYKKAVKETHAGHLSTQVHDKKAREHGELEWNKHMDHQAELANQIRDVCERSDAEDARNAKINEMENNQVLAQHHASRRWAKKQAEEEERVKHLQTVVQQDKDRLKDDYKVGSNGKIMKGDYRRMTVEEEHDIYNQNAQIILEKRIKKQQEIAEEAAHAQQTLGVTNILHAVANVNVSMHKERTRNFLKDNEAMAAAKREQDAQERVRYMQYEPDYMK